jgi:hypothetical protein
MKGLPFSFYGAFVVVLCVLSTFLGVARADGPVMIDVSTTGATPSDGQDDTLGVLAAFEKCRAEKAAGIAFPKGRYEFHEGANPASPNQAFSLQELSGAMIDGQGSEFIFSGNVGCFSFNKCEKITMKNIVVDWDRPPFSVGTIVAADKTSFDVEIFPEFPVKGGEMVAAFMDYEPDTFLPREHGLDVYRTENPMKTELIAPQKLRVLQQDESFRAVVGKLAVLRHSVYDHCAFSATRSRDVVYENVVVYTCPGMAFVSSDCENVTLERCVVQPRPGERRVISATADGSHFGGCTGDIIVRNCLFDGQGDDAINMKSGLFVNITQIVDSKTVVAKHNLGYLCVPDPGDKMELTPQETMLAYATVKVQAASPEPDGYSCRITLEEPLPEGVKLGDMLGNVTKLPKARISNCVFQRNRARGMLIQIRDAVVENCVFKDITSAGVLIVAEAVYFYESIPARNVVVRNNVFEHCNYGAAMARGVISMEALTPGWKDAPSPGVFKNIDIENNKVLRTDNTGFFISAADGVYLAGNSFEGVSENPTGDIFSRAIYVQSSKNVTLKGNQIDPAKQGAGFKEPLFLAENNDLSTIISR